MRVDAFNKVCQVYQANANTKTTKTTATSQKDKLEISQTGKDYQIAKQAVSNTQDVRMDKINDIKERMSSGTYSVSAEEVANKIVESFFNASI